MQLQVGIIEDGGGLSALLQGDVQRLSSVRDTLQESGEPCGARLYRNVISAGEVIVGDVLSCDQKDRGSVRSR